MLSLQRHMPLKCLGNMTYESHNNISVSKWDKDCLYAKYKNKRCFLRKADIHFAEYSGEVGIISNCQIPAYLKI